MMSTQTIRPSAVAGLFYPGSARELANMVDQLLEQAEPVIGPPKALVVPHAGYIYSGSIAASAFAQLRSCADRIRRVVILGPNHRVPLDRIAMPSNTAFATPLGDVPVDQAYMRKINDLNACIFNDEAHKQEHALEVMLPFLQRLCRDFTVVPLVVGKVPADQVREVLARLWGGPETLIIISSDLSHYLSGAKAEELDLQTAGLIEKLQSKDISGQQACGGHPLKGLLGLAGLYDLRITRLDLQHSGRTAGANDKVVGYGAWGFEYAASARLSGRNRKFLKNLARKAVMEGAETGKVPKIDFAGIPIDLQTVRASFTTITVDGEFRGCRGIIRPETPVALDVMHNAFQSAFDDPRVPPLSLNDAKRAEIGISILSHQCAIPCDSEASLCTQLSPDRDGLILAEGQRRAVFLPKVWNDLPDAKDFIAQLMRKGGWQAGYWSDEMKAYRFSAEYF